LHGVLEQKSPTLLLNFSLLAPSLGLPESFRDKLLALNGNKKRLPFLIAFLLFAPSLGLPESFRNKLLALT
jgi:hypothetical protein